jgi:RNA polymerase sigma-70 factor, ECF subfamily
MTERETTFEGELIRRVQAGEQQAFQQIAGQHTEQLFSCALTLCRDRQLAEDISQETLLEAWKSIGRFDGRCRFSTWLYGILRHRFLKARERAARRIVAESSSDDPQSSSQTNSQSTSQLLADPARISERAEDAERVRKAVAALPDEHRQVIELRFFADAKLDDIAAALDIPLGTVKSRLHNGMEKLRQLNLDVNLFSATGESPARQP